MLEASGNKTFILDMLLKRKILTTRHNRQLVRKVCSSANRSMEKIHFGVTVYTSGIKSIEDNRLNHKGNILE